MRTIIVIFTDKKVSPDKIHSYKEHKFLCNYRNIDIYDMIVDPRYDKKMMVVRFTCNTDRMQQDRLLNEIYITEVNGQPIKQPAGLVNGKIVEDEFNTNKQSNNMTKERNIKVTLEQAIEWYNSGKATLKELALKCFNESELVGDNFKKITTFEAACDRVGLYYKYMTDITKLVATDSKASAAMYKLNIIRKALNLGHDLYLAKASANSCLYFPCNPFEVEYSNFYRNELNSNKMEIIGMIKNEGILYKVLGGDTYCGSFTGLGHFSSRFGIGSADAALGFLGCATQEIAQHFGKYFGMLITEAKYGDMVDFEIVEDKYGNTK